MKKYLLTLALLLPLLLHAQNGVLFEFAGEASPAKTRMAQAATRLLTAINEAEASGSPIDYADIPMDSGAIRRLDLLWNNLHLRVLDDDIVEHCLKVKTSDNAILYYQIRHIMVALRPVIPGFEGDSLREATLTFSPDGTLTDLCLALTCTPKIIHDGELHGDTDHRMQLMHWLEQYTTAYYSKDIEFIKDAHINLEPPLPNSKTRPHVTNLQRVFRQNGFVNIRIDEVEIMRHKTNPTRYGVKMKHGWSNQGHSEDDLSLWVWSLENEKRPKLLVSTAQPADTEEGDIYTLEKFYIK